jgi:pyruvate formate lyase activating enzyme
MICNFCYRHCNIKEGNTGFCGVRKIKNNQLISTGYGYLDAVALDPIEKKPLYHFLPGSKTLSVAESGCNYHCAFCQNWQLSQNKKNNNSTYVSPKELVNLALKYKVPSISFTYSEPIVWQDYVIDTSIIAKKTGIKTVMVTNGSFSKEARETLAPLIDAFNIDLKGNADYYKKICKGTIEPVLEGIKYLIEKGNHVEITTLLIESIHTEKDVQALAKNLKDFGVQVWHLSRFFPNYEMSAIAETSEKFLSEMINIAKESGIPYVYGGNTSRVESTICSNCKQVLINNHTDSEAIKKDCNQNIPKGRCKYCDYPIYGAF